MRIDFDDFVDDFVINVVWVESWVLVFYVSILCWFGSFGKIW